MTYMNIISYKFMTRNAHRSCVAYATVHQTTTIN